MSTFNISGFDASNLTRTYNVYVPSTYDNTKPVPLHITFHGLNAPCLNIYDNFKVLAEQKGYILVAPCAADGRIGRAWNSGMCCGFADSKVDDFNFTTTIVSEVTEKLCIDAGRVWASGFSSGGMMAEVLACRHADIFSAVASVSGVVELRPGNKQGLAACDDAVKASPKRASVINVHGDSDPVVPWGGNAILGFPSVTDDFTAWGARFGCGGAAVPSFTKGKYSGQKYTNCTGGAEIELVRVHGGGHHWPHDSDFDTTIYVQDFLERNLPSGAERLPVARVAAERSVEVISVWPEDHVFV